MTARTVDAAEYLAARTCHFCLSPDDLKPIELTERERGGPWHRSMACGRCWAKLRPELQLQTVCSSQPPPDSSSQPRDPAVLHLPSRGGDENRAKNREWEFPTPGNHAEIGPLFAEVRS